MKATVKVTVKVTPSVDAHVAAQSRESIIHLIIKSNKNWRFVSLSFKVHHGSKLFLKVPPVAICDGV